MDAAAHRPPRLHNSLTVRLLVLVMATVLLIDLLYFGLALQHEWRGWMRLRLEDAQLVAFATRSTPPAATTPALRALTEAEEIRVLGPGPRIVLASPVRSAPARRVDLDHVQWLAGLREAVQNLRSRPGETMALNGTGARGIRLQMVVRQPALARSLDRFALQFLTVALAIAALLGGLLFVAVRAMLVTPLLRIAGNIAAFRADPEGAVTLQPGASGDDEITLVGHELAVLQAELRTALWRNARLAAVGTAMAKMSHDLRGILSSAMLVADRLTMSQDPPTRQAGEVILRAVHRATALMQQTLDFVREGRTPLARLPLALRPVVEEAGMLASRDAGRPCRVVNEVDPGLIVTVDRESLLRVLGNLMRNAAQAGARTITVRVEGAAVPPGALQIADDGPGLPGAVQASLFKPFIASRSGGSGLGLAIARDLVTAHGGELTLAETGPQGTRFTLTLHQARRAEE